MKKLIIIVFAATGIIVSSCNGIDKTNRTSDTSAAKGSGGPADTTQAIDSASTPGGSATTPGSSDTSGTGK